MSTLYLEGIKLEQLDLRLRQIVRECLDEAQQKEHKTIPLEKPNLISRKEASQILGVSLVTLNQWEKKGILMPVRINTRVKYRLESIEQALTQIKDE